MRIVDGQRFRVWRREVDAGRGIREVSVGKLTVVVLLQPVGADGGIAGEIPVQYSEAIPAGRDKE
jgi:hypothetical protein